MKLLTVALAGLVALVAASPVETTAAAASEYKNDDVYIPAVEDRAVDGPSAKYVNDDKVTYHCDRDVWILACPADGGGCATTVMCLVKCIENQRGAECSPETPDKRDVDSEADIDDMKTYECAKDRTGVLVCQFGFCQTDHYCNKGWKCRDKCTCCKRGSVSSREIDDVEMNETPELYAADIVLSTSADRPTRDTSAEALTVVDSNTLASRDAPCAPGTYSCQQNPSSGTAWIITCDFRGKWLYSADCGDMKCIAQSNGVAHCWNPEPEWDLTAPSVSRREEPQDFAMAPLEGVCQTGLYSCGYDAATDTAWIVVCDANQTWQWLRPCGQYMKCSVSPPGSGNVQCLPMAALGARDKSEEVPSDVAPSLTCRRGSYACAYRVSTDSSWVITCDQAGRTWLWSSDCVDNQVCDQSGQDGTAHCIPGPGLTLGAREEGPEVRLELAPSAECTPGEYACFCAPSTESYWVVTCNPAGVWVYSSNCGKGVKCTRSDGGAHCGVKQTSLEATEVSQTHTIGI